MDPGQHLKSLLIGSDSCGEVYIRGSLVYGYYRGIILSCALIVLYKAMTSYLERKNKSISLNKITGLVCLEKSIL